jgi:GT2 family glycosyltransferase
MSHNRRDSLRVVLEQLRRFPCAEVLVADNASSDGTRELVQAWGGNVRLIELDRNLGIAARNVAAREARSDLILMLDDDSYPQEGAVAALRSAFARLPRLGVAGGRVVDVDARGQRFREGREVGSFDWFFRPAGGSDHPPDGFPASFFPEGCCMVRRQAFLEVGGWFEPFFFAEVELELTARMIDAGWDVRYFPQAAFDHRRDPAGRTSPALKRMLRFRVRNQLWYFWLRFPPGLALRRAPLYLAFDLVECLYRGAATSWIGGVWDAWRGRERVRAARRPLRRDALQRAELDRARKHGRLLAHAVMARGRRLLGDGRNTAGRRRGTL